MLSFLVKQAHAQITNPAIGDLGSDAEAAANGGLFTSYFLRIWSALMSVGALVVLIYFIWGAISWISAGGDASKVQKARDRMVQAVIGLILLVASFAIIGFINVLFFGDDFNILNLNFVV